MQVSGIDSANATMAAWCQGKPRPGSALLVRRVQSIAIASCRVTRFARGKSTLVHWCFGRNNNVIAAKLTLTCEPDRRRRRHSTYCANACVSERVSLNTAGYRSRTAASGGLLTMKHRRILLHKRICKGSSCSGMTQARVISLL